MEDVHPLVEVLTYFALGLVSFCGHSVIHHGYGQNEPKKEEPRFVFGDLTDPGSHKKDVAP